MLLQLDKFVYNSLCSFHQYAPTHRISLSDAQDRGESRYHPRERFIESTPLNAMPDSHACADKGERQNLRAFCPKKNRAGIS